MAFAFERSLPEPPVLRSQQLARAAARSAEAAAAELRPETALRFSAIGGALARRSALLSAARRVFV